MTVMGALTEGGFGHLAEPNPRSSSIVTLVFSLGTSLIILDYLIELLN